MPQKLTSAILETVVPIIPRTTQIKLNTNRCQPFFQYNQFLERILHPLFEEHIIDSNKNLPDKISQGCFSSGQVLEMLSWTTRVKGCMAFCDHPSN